jgi:hypothetical protein
MKIDRADSDETMRIAPDPGRNVVIADQRAARSPPRTEKADAHAGLVHRLDRPLERNVFGGQHPMRPATEGLEYWLREKRSRGMLHPGIDDAAHRSIVARGAVDASGMRYPGAQGEISRSVPSVKSRITSSPIFRERSVRDRLRLDARRRRAGLWALPALAVTRS